MPKKIKVATFNVNSIRSRLPVVTNWLAVNSPDILAIQETKVHDSQFPSKEIEDLGYHVTFHGQKAYNGVAIISKEIPSDVSFGLGDIDEPDSARLIRAKIKGITIVNTYVPQGQEMESPKFLYKINWLNRLKDFFSREFKPLSQILWCGDFNIAPEDIDVHDPKGLRGHVCFNEQTTALFQDFLKWGFVDIFRKHKPDGGQYSFFDYRIRGSVERGLGWRVDHILATKPLAKKSVDSYIDMKPRLGEKPSDHAPLIAEFEI